MADIVDEKLPNAEADETAPLEFALEDGVVKAEVSSSSETVAHVVEGQEDVKQASEPASESIDQPSEVKEDESKSNQPVSEEKPVVAEEKEKTEDQNVKSDEKVDVAMNELKPPESPPDSMYWVKIARVPKDVLNWICVNEEAEGTVRINLSQLKHFVNQLWDRTQSVNASVWQDCPYPVFDLAIPPNAKKYAMVNDFDNSNPEEAEKRLAENLTRFREKELERYKLANDDEKRAFWKDLKREFTLTNNRISMVGPKPTAKKPASKDIPSQIKPADPLPVGEAAAGGKASKTPNKAPNNAPATIGMIDVRSAAKNGKKRKRGHPGGGPVEASPVKKPVPDSVAPAKKVDSIKAPQVAANKLDKTPMKKQEDVPAKNSNPRPNQNQAVSKTFPKKNTNPIQKNGPANQKRTPNAPGNKWTPNAATNTRNSDGFNNRNRRNFETHQSPWGDGRARANFNSYNQQQQPAPFQQPQQYSYSLPAATGMGGSYQGGYAAAPRESYYDPSIAQRERDLMERERRLLQAASYMQQGYVAQQQQQQQSQQQQYGEQSREFRTTFDEYSAVNYNSTGYSDPYASSGGRRY